MTTNWEEIRRLSSGERCDEWPEGVYAITIRRMSLLGVHEKRNKLYWDGQEIVTKQVVSLRWFELTLATLATIGTFGYFLLELGKTLCWWH